jgi:hypothetical protein
MAAWLTAAPAYSETRALLVGVSRYGSTVIPDLVGPANDLVAMERLARGMGGTDVMVLKDAAATRSSVEAALQGIGSRSRPGDWFLLYYSGHGARAAASAGSGENAFDQFVLLPGFDPAKQNPEHFIVDKDFYAWLRRYVPSDVRILMMVDSCHSGSMHRAIDQRAFAFTSRLFRAGGERAFELVSRPGPRLPALRPGAAEAGGDAIREDLPNLAYLGASRDDQLALETELPQEGAPRRGVLTFAFEQGLTTPGRNEASPAADLDGDGMVTLLEISSYLNSQVRLLSAQRQDSTASFPSAWTDLPLFSKLPTPRPPPDFPAPAVVITAAPELRLDIPAVLSWRVTTSADEADFIWDVGTREVVRRSGDLIASGVTSVAAFGGVLEKWQLVQALLPLVSELTMRVFVDPNGSDFLYGAGTTVKLTLSRTERSAGTRYATVFNLASDGTVQLLYPLAGEGDGAFSARDTVSILETSVVAPYGVDHIVAVATPEIPTQLRAALRTADGSRAAGRLLGLIRAELKKAKGRGSLSIAEIYTGS